MSVIPFTEARSHFAEILNEVAYGGERIIVSRKGKKLAAIIPLDDLEIYEALEDYLDISVAKLVDEDIEKHGTVAWEKIKIDLDL